MNTEIANSGGEQPAMLAQQSLLIARSGRLAVLSRRSVVAWAILIGVAGPGAAQGAADCAALAALRLQSTSLSAAVVPAGFTAPTDIFDFGHPVRVTVPFCRVEGIIAPAIRFEVWLPSPSTWNQRLQGVGGGGMAGAIDYTALAKAVETGYAGVTSDLGHVNLVFNNADWAIGQPSKVIDWGHRATHEMTVKAKAIMAAYYGSVANWSYFTGCSGGGRQGLMEAQRYPEDYDGILAGDPTISFTRLTAAGRLWGQLAMLRDSGPGAYIPAVKIPAIAAAVLAACDRLDGVADGVLEDPRDCHIDPASLVCQHGEGNDCLSAPQAKALGRIYAGAQTSAGKPIFPGYEPGGELGPGGWTDYLSGDGPFRGNQWGYAAAFLRGMVFEDPHYDPVRFDYDTDISRMDNKPIGAETLARTINADDPNLSSFRAHGGRMIHYHGWSDMGVAPRSSVDYYEGVIARTGAERQSALAEVRSFYRLFMVPGMQHCSGGPGATEFDGLAALRDWVEKGRAPERIVARRTEGGMTVRTHPICAYPERAAWLGGDSRRAENFVCRSAVTSR